MTDTVETDKTIKEERFDYTQWHHTLYEGMSVREISAAAMKRREEEKRNKVM